jgi:hypothetical protein
MPKKNNNNRQCQLQYITRTSNNENKNTLKLNTETNVFRIKHQNLGGNLSSINQLKCFQDEQPSFNYTRYFLIKQ